MEDDFSVMRDVIGPIGISLLALLMIPVLAFGTLLLTVWAEAGKSRTENMPFDSESEGVVDVCVRGDTDIERWTVGTGKRITETEPFDSEVRELFYLDNMTEGYFDESGRFRNRLRGLGNTLTDGSGERVPVTEELEGLFRQLEEEQEHAIMSVTVYDMSGDYLACVELNVNWWSPCALYYYCPKEDKLTKLYTFDDRRIVGARLRNRAMLCGCAS